MTARSRASNGIDVRPTANRLRHCRQDFVVTRATKHEPIDLSKLDANEVVVRTGKVFGSKFAVGWTLTRYVDWIAPMLEQLAWGPKTGRATHDERLAEVVGICRGRFVHTIRMVSDGRYVHAYPVEDA